MKILFQKDYDDLIGQIERAEASADEANLKISKIKKEKDEEIKKLNADLKMKGKTLLLTETELVRVREQRDKAELEIKELKIKNRKCNSQKGGYTKQINKLSMELKYVKNQLLEKEKAIENFKTELKKHIPRKSVIEYERGIRR